MLTSLILKRNTPLSVWFRMEQNFFSKVVDPESDKPILFDPPLWELYTASYGQIKFPTSNIKSDVPDLN